MPESPIKHSGSPFSRVDRLQRHRGLGVGEGFRRVGLCREMQWRPVVVVSSN